MYQSHYSRKQDEFVEIDVVVGVTGGGDAHSLLLVETDGWFTNDSEVWEAQLSGLASKLAHALVLKYAKDTKKGENCLIVKIPNNLLETISWIQLVSLSHESWDRICDTFQACLAHPVEIERTREALAPLVLECILAEVIENEKAD